MDHNRMRDAVRLITFERAPVCCRYSHKTELLMEFEIVSSMETLGPICSYQFGGGTGIAECIFEGKYCAHVPARLLMLAHVAAALRILHVYFEMVSIWHSGVSNVVNVVSKFPHVITSTLGYFHLWGTRWAGHKV